jgi:anti-sigma B factor antagonist
MAEHVVRKAKSRSRKDARLKLSVNVSEFGETVILHCEGRICFRDEAMLLSRRAGPFLEDHRNLILDLACARMLDSAGVGELVLIYMRASAAECTVRIASPNKRVRDLLELTNVASLFEIYPTVEEALASLSREVA